MRRVALAAAIVATVMMSSPAAQYQGRRFGGRFGYGPSVPPNAKYDGAFMFCRIMFRNAPDGDGGGWSVDYPRADVNLSFRLSELTETAVSRDATGDFNHSVIRLTDMDLFRCPFIMMTEVGGTYFDDQEAAQLREYLLRGGFLWADDFWGEYAWAHWENELRKVLPSGQYPIFDIPMEHPLFHVLYDVHELPQIPSINYYFGSGGNTSERPDSRVPHARGIADANGNLMVFITHNTDFGDAFEREGDNREYFERFAGPGYAVGIDVLLYSMTH
jgi:Domain of unknown function (DUF4159)